jgi:hypothetical protein
MRFGNNSFQSRSLLSSSYRRATRPVLKLIRTNPFAPALIWKSSGFASLFHTLDARMRASIWSSKPMNTTIYQSKAIDVLQQRAIQVGTAASMLMNVYSGRLMAVGHSLCLAWTRSRDRFSCDCARSSRDRSMRPFVSDKNAAFEGMARFMVRSKERQNEQPRDSRWNGQKWHSLKDN